MRAIASQITSPTIVYSTDYSGTDQRKLQSSASLAFFEGIAPVTGEFPAQRASNAEKISTWWRHPDIIKQSTLDICDDKWRAPARSSDFILADVLCDTWATKFVSIASKTTGKVISNYSLSQKTLMYIICLHRIYKRHEWPSETQFQWAFGCHRITDLAGYTYLTFSLIGCDLTQP